MTKSVLSALALLMLATPALSGCTGGHTFGTCADGIVHWYDPDTGEICDPLNCGGDRAGPARTDVPGCLAYKGTVVPETSPSYMPCWTGFSSNLPASPTAETTTSDGTSQVDEATATVSDSSSPTASATSDDSGESRVDSTSTGNASSTATGSESAALTTAPPASTPADTGASASSDAADSSTSTGLGNVVGRSWIAVGAGVVLGAVAVI